MNALEIEHLEKTYSSGVQAVRDLSLSVPEGAFFGLLGPNGAGKTTTLNILTSLVLKTAGTVSVFGHDIDHDFESAKCCIGLVPQEMNFNSFETVFNVVVTQAGYYGIPRREACARAEHYLKALQLWPKRHASSRRLSGGMKRRLMIARALVNEPKLLILDEPTAGVDIDIRRSMWDFLRELNAKGTTIILTSHYLEEIEQLCEQVAIINKGRLISCLPMKALLDKLPKETFVLDLATDCPPDFSLPGFSCQRKEARTLEVSIDRGQSVNDLFAVLTKHNITVTSFRNRASRLEEIFLNLTHGESNV